MTYASTSFGPSPLASGKWRVRHSAWLLAVIFGLGFFSFVGFVYCAVRVQSRKWWAIASLSSVLTLALWVMVFSSEKVDGKTQVSDAAAAYYLLVWVGSIAAGFWLNRDYLRWRAGQTAQSAWYNQGVAAAYAPPPTGSQRRGVSADVAAPQGYLGVDNRQYYAAPPPRTHQQPPSPPVTQPSVPPPAPAKVDVNSASVSDLALVLGDSGLANQIVTARERGVEFQNLNDLAVRTGLQPHQLARIRERAIFGPAVTPRAPQAERDSGGGRILDF